MTIYLRYTHLQLHHICYFIPSLDHPRRQKPVGRMDYLMKFSQQWLSELDNESIRSLSMLLVFQLVHYFKFTWTNAEKRAAHAVGKGERSVRRWRSNLVKHKGKFSRSDQGRCSRTGVLWSNEKENYKICT